MNINNYEFVVKHCMKQNAKVFQYIVSTLIIGTYL